MARQPGAVLAENADTRGGGRCAVTFGNKRGYVRKALHAIPLVVKRGIKAVSERTACLALSEIKIFNAMRDARCHEGSEKAGLAGSGGQVHRKLRADPARIVHSNAMDIFCGGEYRSILRTLYPIEITK